MKKLFLTTALILCSIVSMAQVNFFNGTFSGRLNVKRIPSYLFYDGHGKDFLLDKTTMQNVNL